MLWLLSFVVYAFFFAGGGWNQNSQFDLTRAIVEKHSLAIDDYAANTGDISRFDGHIYSNKSPGLSLMAAIPYALIHAIEAGRVDLSSAPVVTINAYLCSLFAVAIPGAAIASVIFLWGRRRGASAAWSAGVALIVALSTQLLPYSTLLMAHVPSAAALFASFYLVVWGEKERTYAGAGLLAGLAGLTNYLCIPVIVILCGLLVFRLPAGQRIRQAIAFAAGATGPMLLLAIYQQLTTGGFARTPISTMDPRFVAQHALLGILKLPSLEALIGVTISPYRGLFFFSPVLIAGLAGLVVSWRSRSERSVLVAVAAILALFFGFNITFNGWEGGFGIGARYLVPLVPFLGIGLYSLKGRFRVLVVMLAVCSFAINFAATVVDPQPSGTIPRPLTQYIVPLLVTGRFPASTPITPPWSAQTFTGRTSVNRVTMNEPVPFLLYAPYSHEADWASFNLGEIVLGPGELVSVVPLLVVMLAGLWLILIRARKIDRLTLQK